MEHCAAAFEPLVPCLCGWMVCCDSRVQWVADGTLVPDGVALTIDDVPRKGTQVAHVLELMRMLHQRNARATFFVFFDRLNYAPDDTNTKRMVEAFVHGVKEGNHEVGLHFPGRWGNQMSLVDLKGQTMRSLAIAKRFGLPVRYVRMPGGFSTPAQVEYLNSQNLTVVNGTAYPGDADVCGCLAAKVLGRCAARLANNGEGRIVILHDDKRLIAKLAAFFEQLYRQQKRAVTLSELFGPLRIPAERVLRSSGGGDTALAPLFVPL